MVLDEHDVRESCDDIQLLVMVSMRKGKP